MDDVKKFHASAETQLNELQRTCEALALRFTAAVEQGACWTARAFDAILVRACCAPWTLTLAMQLLTRARVPVSHPTRARGDRGARHPAAQHGDCA